ncbi:putative membrane protein [Methanohalophilus levihalophilus]|uniref:glycerophosphoryl diester phosphodiesterase membrane domain-containing protein n=1 Tax=Methanohalophilus levihalophilus TaxID=1431282 RepID=UPI001AE606F5|nr:glycerophosphoryl diester phosphodiesterase membrane domain-containing protein [Methanohalophilus levihalophilus]MBP2031021.1 putative membrane protein [Methanohalophilus levihalophilus]
MDHEQIFSDTWNVFRKDFVTYIIATLIVSVGSILVITAPPLFYGIYYMVLKGIRGEEIEIKDVFEGFNYFVKSWVFAIVAVILLAIGFMLLFIPGLVLMVLLIYALPLLVIRDYGGVDAIKESIEIGRANFVDTLILAIVIWIISAIGGYVVVGFLITLPIVAIAETIATMRMLEARPDEYTDITEDAEFEEVEESKQINEPEEAHSQDDDGTEREQAI